MTGAPLLSVRDLRVRFGSRGGTARVVNGVSYDLHRGETLAIVGESGSGKTVSALALTGLLPQPPGRIDGEAIFGGRNLIGADADTLRRVRGRHIGMIFQDPTTSLNPVLTVGLQIAESLEVHLGLSRRQGRDRAVDLLHMVGIPEPARRLDDYPHQFSGGMCQRVMIAIGLACNPELLIADEPTTALDVTTQAVIVDLVRRLQREIGMAVMWITHDLGVVAGIADRVLVMYGGTVLEEGSADELYRNPLHPYTRALLESLPVPGSRRRRLRAIEGLPPDPTDLPTGCLFYDRCRERLDERCLRERPPLGGTGPGHRSACWYGPGHPQARPRAPA